MTREEKTQEAKRLRELYYSTKRRTNYHTDVDSILNTWEQAKSYLDDAMKLERELKETV